jgi:eukaryotic-like serine/threonine-protein kinase
MKPSAADADDLTRDSDEVLAELLERLIAQARTGGTPQIERVAAEHPELQDELRQLWATVRVAEDLASGADAIDLPAAAPPPAPSVSGPLPRSVGDYDLLEVIGRGGMGVVYRARQRSLSRIVAIKMILRGELATDADLARFRVEAEASARLEHPHIVKVFDVGQWQQQPFFSMQYVEGRTLAQLLIDGPLPPRQAAELLGPVCRAIAHAHRHGVLHRDLKPSNILIDGEDRPYVTDFGLAKRVETVVGGSLLHSSGPPATSDPLTQTGAILGTPGYMAPEQAAGSRGDVTAATDVYSLGAILYATLTGRPPFQAASPVDVVLMVLEQDPPPPRLLNPSADADLEMIALKALQKPPDLRYASADDLADDLEAYLAGEPISARSSHFSQILSRAFRPTHHVGVMQNWGLLWMWHSLVLLVLCLVTNAMQWADIISRLPYLGLWTLGLGTWAAIFWNLRHRAGPVTFVERQIAHVWAGSMACSTMLYGVEWLLDLPVLTLSPVLPLIAGAVFVGKAGILSGEFYIHAIVMFATCIPMAMFPRWGLTIFGMTSAATFFVPGLKFHRQRLRKSE